MTTKSVVCGMGVQACAYSVCICVLVRICAVCMCACVCCMPCVCNVCACVCHVCMLVCACVPCAMCVCLYHVLCGYVCCVPCVCHVCADVCHVCAMCACVCMHMRACACVYTTLCSPVIPPCSLKIKLLKPSSSKLIIKACICTVSPLIRLSGSGLHKATSSGEGGEGSLLVCWRREGLYQLGEFLFNELSREEKTGRVLENREQGGLSWRGGPRDRKP